MSGNISDDEFLHVLDEMSRLCGQDDLNSQDEDLRIETEEDFLNRADGDRCYSDSSSPATSSRAPLIGDQLLSSTSSRITKRLISDPSPSKDSKEDEPARKRSRNSSANSGMSTVSYDSAIGDIYFAGTPHSALDLDRELLELTSASCEEAAAALSGAVSPTDEKTGDDVCGYEIIFPEVVEDENDNKCCNVDANQIQMVVVEKAETTPQPTPRPLQELLFDPRPPLPRPIMPSGLPLNDNPSNWLREIETLCFDLLNRYRNATCLHPPKKVSAMAPTGEDPLKVTTKLLTDSLVRLRIFLYSLDSFHWLTSHDRNVLYNSQVCCLAILKASLGVKMEMVPLAYPLPYGEYLSEVEALHLILAHDLFNELRSLLVVIKNLDISDFSIMLMVMMVALFNPHPGLQQPFKVIRAHDYYMHKLQTYLSLRYGETSVPSVMTTILSTIDRVRNFSSRLRDFLCDVTRTGLQKQFESVCENIGLIAFLLHSEPSLER